MQLALLQPEVSCGKTVSAYLKDGTSHFNLQSTSKVLTARHQSNAARVMLF